MKETRLTKFLKIAMGNRSFVKNMLGRTKRSPPQQGNSIDAQGSVIITGVLRLARYMHVAILLHVPNGGILWGSRFSPASVRQCVITL